MGSGGTILLILAIIAAMIILGAVLEPLIEFGIKVVGTILGIVALIATFAGGIIAVVFVIGRWPIHAGIGGFLFMCFGSLLTPKAKGGEKFQALAVFALAEGPAVWAIHEWPGPAIGILMGFAFALFVAGLFIRRNTGAEVGEQGR